MKFSSAHMLVPPGKQHEYAHKLDEEIVRMKQAAAGNDDLRESITLPFDDGLRKIIHETAAKYANVETLVVVGIGGSNLGTMAVYDAVQPKGPRVFFADTVDADQTSIIISEMRKDLRAGKRVLVNAISKSGGTTETLALFSTLIGVLKGGMRKWEEDVVITSGDGSKFWNYGKKHGIMLLPIPEHVGGRYSVLSAVGLFPFAVLGIDIEKLCKGAREMRDRCLLQYQENPAMQSASSIYHHYVEGKNIHDTFLFSPKLESLGKWYRQLMGESIGKENDWSGNKVNIGITPTTSIGSTDLHSVSQLYLGGPHDKTWTIVTSTPSHAVRVPEDNDFESIVPHSPGSMHAIMDAIAQGFMNSLQKQDRPYMHISLSDTMEESIGGFLQMKMCEMMYLAHLLHVNPFDQPNVESYKQLTRDILASKKPRKHIIIGADHAGYLYKKKIIKDLLAQEYTVDDLGTHSEDPVDYPVYAARVARKVASGEGKGILICGTGTGMVMAANRIPGARAQVAYDEYSARMGRTDNDANILCLRSRENAYDLNVVHTWLTTEFSGEERHTTRIAELEQLECDK